nr:hypothetical protein [Tanacetum cinerariifolium]
DIDVDVEINLDNAQARGYNLDLDHQEKVFSMMDVNQEEPADVEEVLEVVKAGKLMTEVVTTAGVTKVSVLRKRRCVIIQDPNETTTIAIVQPKEKSSKQGRKIADIDVDVEINLDNAQARGYNLDLDHQEKVFSMMDVNQEEPADVEEVLEVVKAGKLMTEVVTTAGVTK